MMSAINKILSLPSWWRREDARFAFRALRARIYDQRVALSIIQKHVRSGDIVCDIGAYKGSFTFWLARWCEKGAVVAFEPQPRLPVHWLQHAAD